MIKFTSESGYVTFLAMFALLYIFVRRFYYDNKARTMGSSHLVPMMALLGLYAIVSINPDGHGFRDPGMAAMFALLFVEAVLGAFTIVELNRRVKSRDRTCADILALKTDLEQRLELTDARLSNTRLERDNLMAELKRLQEPDLIPDPFKAITGNCYEARNDDELTAVMAVVEHGDIVQINLYGTPGYFFVNKDKAISPIMDEQFENLSAVVRMTWKAP